MALFHCDEKFTHGHKQKNIFNIEGNEESLEEDKSEESSQEKEEEEEKAQISFNALTDQTTPETIKVMGKVINNPITILLDISSTHSLLDAQTAKTLGYECWNTPGTRETQRNINFFFF